MKRRSQRLVFAAAVAWSLVVWSKTASAHCDTLNGPVVAAARLALQKGDVTPVLKWIKAADEAEIRQVFAQTLGVRKMSQQARDLADRYFFETLVRVHRQGEGAPYTGLKPAAPDPAIDAADKAIEDGSVDRVAQLMAGDVAAGVRLRFTRVVAARKHADQSIEAGREFVEAYVEYVHYVENIRLIATNKPAAHTGIQRPASAAAHGHK